MNSIRNIRTSYDAIADAYAAELFDELEHKPLDRALLDRFAEAVAPLGVAVDLGCGPGQIARYLHECGIPVIGVDLSPGMVDLAKQLTPQVEFFQGDMWALNVPDGSWGGIAAFYAIVHVPPLELASVLSEWQRVLVPNGIVLLSFHRGHESVHRDEMWARPVNLDFVFFERAEVENALHAAGFEVLEVSERAPYPEVEYPSHRIYIFARKR